ncbi:efflux transporter outer membrane subunit [Desulfogranum mediterraneum]|uniref:efflux transporter outer membrane subunit n=1 Tax=Desulfogranum mediterraneum TaxID=160661 RepID=UPI0003FA6E68|nr:TolC family protein [Desulfogranum mediterraneum]
MKRYFYPLLWSLLLVFALSGCSQRMDYLRPEIAMPGAWQEPVPQQAPPQWQSALRQDPWWHGFGDPRLNQLIDEVLRVNHDIIAAGIRLQQARLQAGLSATNRTPEVKVSTSWNINKDLRSGVQRESSGASLSIGYQVDLWGKLAAVREKAEWEVQASEEDRQATALTLVGTSAKLYWQLAYLQQSLDSGQEELEYLGELLGLSQAKYEAGAVSSLELLQLGRQLAERSASMSELRRRKQAAANRLALLLDRAPGPLALIPDALPEARLPAIAAGIPAELLGRRPDLRAAEYRLRAALAEQDRIRLSFYPDLTLTGSGGTGTDRLAQILESPVATLGVSLLFPFVQYNTSQLTIKIAAEEYQLRVVDFRQLVFQAFAEVEDALAAYRYGQEQLRQLEQALDRQHQIEEKAALRYRAGATGIQAWLDEQDRLRSLELTVAAQQREQLNVAVTLYQAIGGAIPPPAG